MQEQPAQAAAEPSKQVCGLCNDEFLTFDEFVAHVCPVTNNTPAHVSFMGEDGAAIQAAALQRGLEVAVDSGDQAQADKQQAAIDQHAADNGLTDQPAAQ